MFPIYSVYLLQDDYCIRYKKAMLRLFRHNLFAGLLLVDSGQSETIMTYDHYLEKAKIHDASLGRLGTSQENRQKPDGNGPKECRISFCSQPINPCNTCRSSKRSSFSDGFVRPSLPV